MKRTVNPQTNAQLRAFASTLVARNQMAAKVGMEMFDGRRDLYEALGYPKLLDFKDYYARYDRQDIAKAVIDRPVVVTWQGVLELIETDDAEETPFEKAWRDLNYKFKLKGLFERVDRLTGLGRYGVLLLGLSDVKKQEDFINPAKASSKLLYIKPFSESTAKIDTFVTDPSNERYGFPLYYSIEVTDASAGASQTVRVHYSRIIHIVDNSLESEIYGTPRLKAVFNRLYDIEKIVGGSAEMYWRGARPGYNGTVNSDYTMTPSAKEDLQDEIEEYENNLRRFLITEGVEIKDLSTQISDPKNHLDVQLTLVSAVTGIPKRILSGSERGELSSAQDAGEWKTYVKARRENQAEPQIIRPFVDRLIELKILPVTVEYHIDWDDLFATSEQARVDTGKSRANALREYTYSPLASAIVPPEGFLEFFLGFDRKQIEYMNQLKTDDVLEEVARLMEGPEEDTMDDSKQDPKKTDKAKRTK